MGTAGAKAFGDTLLVNKTIQTLDVSDNSFGKPQVGDEVKIKSSGEMKVVTTINSGGDHDVKIQGSDSWQDPWTAHSEYEWESQVPAFCTGVAASPSLISVSTTFRHALVTSCSISHSSPHFYRIRSSMLPPTALAQRVERPSLLLSLRTAPLLL